MTYNQIVDHYGGLSKAAKALDFNKQRIFAWKRNRIPSEVQIDIAQRTGCLKPDAKALRDARRLAAYVNGT